VDGVILLAPQFSAGQCHIIKNYGMPMVMANNEGSPVYANFLFTTTIFMGMASIIFQPQ